MFFQNLFSKIGAWFKNFGIAIKNFFKNIPSNTKKFFIKLGLKFKAFGIKYYTFFKEGDLGVKLSFILMGTGAFFRKQIAKGLVYLIFELLFILYMILNGFGAIRNFFTLGTSFSYDL